LQLGSHPVAVVHYTRTHTNNTENDTKQTIHRTTQTIHRATQKLGRVRAVPRLCGFYPGVCLTTEEKARKNLSVRVVIHKHTASGDKIICERTVRDVEGTGHSPIWYHPYIRLEVHATS
jgi:hypothetical protein